VTALAGLESGRLHAQTHMPRACSGAYRIGSRIVHCWKLTGHGSFNLVQAVQQSCNIYFYQTGLLLGDVVINRYAALLGLGEKTGIDLPGEKTGWLSGEEAYNRRFSARRGWKWTQGLVCDLAIGQAQILTPIQLALMGGGIGTGHLVYRPRLLMSARRPDNGAVTMERSPEVLRKLEISPENLAVMHEAMVDVIGPGGTAGRAAVPGVNVGGKTGSAQNPQGDKTHALFVACAPIENPTIAISVVVENAGHGGSVAAPIAGRILRYYFKHVAPVKPDTTVDSMLVALERLTTAVPLVKR